MKVALLASQQTTNGQLVLVTNHREEPEIHTWVVSIDAATNEGEVQVRQKLSQPRAHLSQQLEQGTLVKLR
jgi:DNA topoisomerase VI subunit B